MHKVISVISKKPINHQLVTSFPFKTELQWIPTDYPLLALNKEFSQSTTKIGLLTFYSICGGLVKTLIRDKVIELPIYVFKEAEKDFYSRESILIPKLIRDMRNVPRSVIVFKAIIDENTIYI